MVPFGDTPACEHVPSDHRHKIMHARLEAGDQVLMGSDTTPPHPYEGVKGSSVAIQVKDPAEAERVFHALADGGTVTLPIQQTFWAVRFGMLVDRFGVPWMVNGDPAS
jgi:PhnB protein